MSTAATEPRVHDAAADQRFAAKARSMQLDPNSKWVGGYVAYEWAHSRYFFERYFALDAEQPLQLLEFGCNYGASAIVTAQLGARVTAVDVAAEALELAEHNAARFGLSEHIDFHHVPDTTALPFADASFNAINCNSVLEYVPPRLLPGVLRELHRVMAPGGTLLISGTSNRLWPREVHSSCWLINWLPRSLGPLLARFGCREWGLNPWLVIRAFRGWENPDFADGSRRYLDAKAAMGMDMRRRRLLAALARLLRPFGLTPGLLMPSFFLVLRRPE